ncbi:MAG: hypothetical protein K0S76_1342, partial [Herbinix sp.]|nr:hypothetical protein [Herbinix sp.]
PMKMGTLIRTGFQLKILEEKLNGALPIST